RAGDTVGDALGIARKAAERPADLRTERQRHGAAELVQRPPWRRLLAVLPAPNRGRQASGEVRIDDVAQILRAASKRRTAVQATALAKPAHCRQIDAVPVQAVG